jgi:hypothetical protein
MVAAYRDVLHMTAPQQTLMTAPAPLLLFTIRQNRKRYQHSVLSAAVTIP